MKTSSQPNAHEASRWVINYRLLAVSLLVVIVTTPAIYAWHSFQMRSNSATLLTRATAFEGEGKYSQAAGELFRYLKLHPEENTVRVRLANDFGKTARTPSEKSRAAQLYAAAIAAAPNQAELRREHMQLLLQLGDFSAALSEADACLDRHGKDPEALRVRAMSTFAKWHYNSVGTAESVAEALEQAHLASPSDAEIALQLARIYRTHLQSNSTSDQLAARADAVMNTLVQASEHSPEALLVRYIYRQEFGLPDADRDLLRAAEGDAKQQNARVQLAAGEHALRARQWEQAAKRFQAVVKQEPLNAAAYAGLAQAYRENGDDARAIETLKQGATKVDPNEFELQFQLAVTHIKAGRYRDATKILETLEPKIAKLLGKGQNELLIRLFGMQAQLKLLQQDVAGAIPLLRRMHSLGQAITDSKQQVAFKAQTLIQLGLCYRALQQWDQAAAAYQQAAEMDPKDANVRLDAARAWAAAGQLDDAAKQFAIATSIDGVNASAWIDYARLLLQQQALVQTGKRNWKPFETALEEARALATDSPALLFLEADYEWLQDRRSSAASKLRSLEGLSNLEPADVRKLVLAYDRVGSPADANRIYKQLQSRVTPATALDSLLLGVELLVGRNELAKAEQLIKSQLARFGDQERVTVQYTLADVLLLAEKREEANATLLDIVQRSPQESRALQQLLDLSLTTAPTGQVTRWIDSLQSLEGPEGTVWRFYRAQLLLREVVDEPHSKTARTKLDTARQLQADIQRLRPNWPLGYLLLARVHQTPVAPDDALAIQAYDRALQLGDAQLRTFEQLLNLLYRQGRIAEAAGYLDRLQGTKNLTPSLSTISVAIDAQQGNFERAIEAAREFVAREPERADARLQLGHLLLMDRKRRPDQEKAALSEAETQFARATQLEPANASAWSARLALYVGTNRPDSARKLLAQLQESSEFAKVDRALFLAQSYELLGDRVEAHKWFEEAVQSGADRADVQREASRFFSGVDTNLAEQCARRALQLDPEDKSSRRLLATLLIDRGGKAEELEEAWKLIDSAGKGGDKADRRLEAVFLLRRGGIEFRGRAKKILEGLVSEGGSAVAVDRLLLAQVFEAEGDLDAAREQLSILASQKSPAPAHLAAFAQLLLKCGRAEEAAAAVDQLAAREPEDLSLRTLGLRVRTLQSLGKGDKVSPLLEQFLKKHLTSTRPANEQAQLLIAIGELCASAELYKPAENCFRQALKREPLAYGPLAGLLVTTNRLGEAIDVCIASAEHDQTALPAVTLVNSILTHDLNPADRERVEKFLADSQVAHPNDAKLLQSLGTLRLLEGKRDQAINCLRKTIRIEPRNLDALNNLALLLSEEVGTQDEAVGMIDRAIEIGGKSPELLDSKGWILLKQARFDRAEEMFLEALSLPPGDPRHRFHLAVAYHLQGKRAEAKASLSAARSSKLPEEMLSPEERSQLAKLEADLK